MRKRPITFRGYSVAILAVTVAMSAVLVAGASVAGAATPRITAFGATPKQLTWTGGTLVLRADTSDTVKCTFSSNYKINGLPVTEPCPGGHPGHTLDIARNTGTTVKYIEFTLKAYPAKGSPATATITVPQTPEPAAITSFTASTTKLPATGGNVTLTGKMVRAVACVLSVSPWVSGLPWNYNCTRGTVTKTVTLPADTTGTESEFVFNLSASGTGAGTSNAQVTVFVTSHDPSVTDFTATPSTLPDTGGTVTLSAQVTSAVGCNYGDSWSGGTLPKGTNPVSNLPDSIACTSGTVTFHATVIADKGQKAETITFLMTVNSQNDVVDATQKPVVTEAGTPPS